MREAEETGDEAGIEGSHAFFAVHLASSVESASVVIGGFPRESGALFGGVRSGHGH